MSHLMSCRGRAVERPAPRLGSTLDDPGPDRVEFVRLDVGYGGDDGCTGPWSC
ncbi:hypothetical protein [Nonomuraea dietziae]|uniref:hypothetical protein n=1 Tax=Nonomuraea dietziae TaxID=65515 RepID=UPI0031DD770F